MERPLDPMLPEPASLAVVLTVLGGVSAGAVLGVLLAPVWLPVAHASFAGAQPPGFWYLSRATGVVAFGLFTLSALAGLAMSTRAARTWPGTPVAFDLHQHASLLGLAFAVFHALVLLGDRYAGYTVATVVVPFAAPDQASWVGAGQLALYLFAIVFGSFYVRARIGQRAWRTLHYASFAAFVLALGHGIFAGTDTAELAVLYWVSGGAVLFLTIYRAVGARGPSKSSRKNAASSARPASPDFL